jgi:8-oxo-dGTP diphosphatase
MIPAVLVYCRRPDGCVLMIHRNAPDRPGDYHAGKWNGLGGKCEADESFAEAARRELEEESSLLLPAAALRPLGIIHFPNFKAHKSEDWMVTVFSARVTDEQASKAIAKTAEGELHWIPAKDLLGLNLWAGDRHFIPFVVDEKPFQGTIWYRGQDVARWDLQAY